VRDPESKLPTPVRTLRGFERVTLKRGEAQPVRFRLSPAKDFTYYDVGKKAYAVEPGEFEVQVGASSQDIRLTGRVRVDP
jgi:beta-glucosidase